jgi:hypothetical protein
MPSMPTKSSLSEAVAARCTPELVAKLDELLDVLAAASPVAVRLNRSDVARAALEVGVDTLLRDHRKSDRRVR